MAHNRRSLVKDPRAGETWERQWQPLPSDLPPHVKTYVTLLVKQFESGRPAMLDCHDLATLIAIKAFEAGRKGARG